MKKKFRFTKMAVLLLALLLLNVKAFADNEYLISGGPGVIDGTRYNTLQLAFKAINDASGSIMPFDDIVITINAVGAADETASAVLNAGNWLSLKIYPTVPGVTITGAINGALIDLNGADNVTIDGRVYQTGDKDMIISNTHATPGDLVQTIKLSADASNNVIQYCTIKGRSIAANNGTVLIGSGITTGNDNNTIDYCDIADGASMPSCGICFNGSIAATNDNNTVSSCNIYNLNTVTAGTSSGFSPTNTVTWSHVIGINIIAYTNTTIISQNKIYWKSIIDPTATYVKYVGILTTGNSNSISGNTIGYADSNGTGTTTITPSTAKVIGFVGIQATGSTTSAFEVTTITRNTIEKIQLTSTGAVGQGTLMGVLAGIFVNTGYVYIGTDNTNGNTIRNLKLITTADYTSFHALNGIAGCGSNDVWIKYNRIDSLSHEVSGNIKAMVRGIQLGAGGGSSRSIPATITGNIIHDLTAGTGSNTSSSVIVQGISNNVTGAALVEKNSIYNLVALSSNVIVPTITGISTTIQDNNSNNFNFKNNMISLGNKSTGSAAITGITFSGPGSSLSTLKVYYYHNSVYIGGTAPTTNGGSVAFNSASTSAAAGFLTAKNNIFVNMRTGGSTAVHYLVRSAVITANTTSWMSGFDYNLYQMQTAGANNKFGKTSNGTFAELADWKPALTGVALDAQSKTGDPLFVDAISTTAPNLRISGASAAKGSNLNLSATVIDDIDDISRVGKAQDMGAAQLSDLMLSILSTTDAPTPITYEYNQDINFTVTYTKAVTVSGGIPSISITLSNNSTVDAVYVSGSGSASLVFRYTVGRDVASTGVTYGNIDLNGAAIVNGVEEAPLTTAKALATVNIDGRPATILSTTPPADNTYIYNQAMYFTVLYSKSVTVNVTGGRPFIPITLSGSTVKNAIYMSGTGTTTLRFVYTVGRNVTSSGVTYGNINLNGGTIVDSRSLSAPLTTATANLSGVVIDGIVNPATILSTTPPVNNTYDYDNNVDFTVNYSENVTVNVTNGRPFIPITLSDNTVKNASYVSGSGGKTLLFRYKVGLGITTDYVTYGNINPNGGLIYDIIGAVPLTTATAKLTGVKMSGIAYGTTITSVTPVANSIYWTGAVLDFKVNFADAVNVAGTPRIPITLNTGGTVYANYFEGSGTTSLTFRYVVGANQSDADGIAIANSIELNGGSIIEPISANTAKLVFTPLVGSVILIDDVVRSAFERRWLTFTAPASGTYGIGKNIDIRVSPVSSTGNRTSALVNFQYTVTKPYIPLTLDGGRVVKAEIVEPAGSFTATQFRTFRYTVVSGDVDVDGISIGNIELNGSTINYGYGANQVGQTVSFASAPIVKISNEVQPSISTISATYGIGQTINFIVTYPEIVNVSGGVPSLAVEVGSTIKNASYISGSGTTQLIFGYTVESGDVDANGLSIGSVIALNGGTIKNQSDIDMTLNTNNLTGTAIVVNENLPSIKSIIYPASATYIKDENLDIKVILNKKVTVTGTPYFPVFISGIPATYLSGSKSDTLTFRYKVRAGAASTNPSIGISIVLNGGTIKDINARSLNLYIGNVPSLPVIVDGGTVAPSYKTITTVLGTADAGVISGDGVYATGAPATLIVRANPGYRFVNWTLNGDVQTTSPYYRFPVLADKTLVANFVSSVVAVSNSNNNTNLSTLPNCETCDVTISDINTSLTVDKPTTVNSLIVASGAVLNATDSLTVEGDLTLKSDETGTFNANLGKGIALYPTSKSYYKKTMLDSKWYFVSFPCTVNINEIKLVGGAVDGSDFVLGTDWYIKYYNGQTRAINRGGSNWVAITDQDGTLTANKGYIIGLKTGVGTKILSFVLDNALFSPEKNARNIGVNVYDANAGTHAGWNLVGQPFVRRFIGSNISGNWKPVAVTIPDALTGKTYTQSLLSVAAFDPFSAYFVQVAGEGDLSFASVSRSSAPAIVASDLTDRVQLNFTSATGTDNTNLIMDNDQSSAYQIGQDLEKWIGTGTDKPQIYTQLGGVNYGFNALPMTEVQNLPVGIYTKTAGTTTISADAAQAPSLSKLLLLDKSNGTVTDLLTTSYSFTAAAGTNNTRFSITAQRVPTGNEIIDMNVDANISMANGKLMLQDIAPTTVVRVYDALGRLVINKTANSTSMEIMLNAKGVYTVQMQNGTKTSARKVIF